MEGTSRNDIARDIEKGKKNGRYKDCVHLIIGEPGPYGSGTFHTICAKQAFEYLQKAHPLDKQPHCPPDCHFFLPKENAMSLQYDEAWICENGHTINSCIHEMPEKNTEFCEKCGAKTVKTCPSCEKPIRGFDWESSGLSSYKVPSYCIHCGSPFPWTQSKIQAAEELIRLNEDLNDPEKEDFVGAVQEIGKDSPQAKVGAEKIKKYARKIGQEAYSVIKDIISDIASETIKKQLGI